MLIIAIVVWAFTIIRLISARKIKVPFSYGNKIVVYIIFAIPAIVLIIKNRSIYSIIFALVIILASALYASIPSGFYEEGIILFGRAYKYLKIENMDIEKNYIDCRLIFDYHKRTHVIVGKKEDEIKFRELINYYQSIRKVNKINHE